MKLPPALLERVALASLTFATGCAALEEPKWPAAHVVAAPRAAPGLQAHAVPVILRGPGVLVPVIRVPLTQPAAPAAPVAVVDPWAPPPPRFPPAPAVEGKQKELEDLSDYQDPERIRCFGKCGRG
jgi:hypothetical protein